MKIGDYILNHGELCVIEDIILKHSRDGDETYRVIVLNNGNIIEETIKGGD